MIVHDPLENTCPLCGQSNACQQAEIHSGQKADDQAEPCWCMSIKLDEFSKQLLKAKTNGKRCLCRNCIQQMNQAQQ